MKDKKELYTYYVSFPYNEKNYYNQYEDLINVFSMEEIERHWNIEFFYPDGRTHKWYEENEWWSNDEIHKQFCLVDGKVDLTRPPLYKGKQMKLNHNYTFTCIYDPNEHHVRFIDCCSDFKIKRT